MTRQPISRRTFLKGVAGLQLCIYLTQLGADRFIVAKVADDGAPEATAGPNGLPLDLAAAVSLNLYVQIDTDDTVTVTIPRPDMGQGPRTSLAMHVAEELEIDWAAVRIVQADADSRYGNQTSGGSTSTRNFWTPMRQAGAAARVMLVSAAAQRWGVDPATCRAERGAVIHDASGRRLTYGEVATAASNLPVPQNPALKAPKDYKIIGQRGGDGRVQSARAAEPGAEGPEGLQDHRAVHQAA